MARAGLHYHSIVFGDGIHRETVNDVGATLLGVLCVRAVCEQTV